jgi:predicted HD phosphohydrolase
MEQTPKPGSLAAIYALFEERGGLVDPGDGITQLEHALQSASLARKECRGDALIAACLLHDLGHMLEGVGGKKHEANGAVWLSRSFPPAVTEPIRLHAEAKRYLLTREPNYRDQLAEASLMSLEFQGGLMSKEELSAFEALPHHASAVHLRRIDDQAKDPKAESPRLESWRMLLARLMTA